jgi:predicted nucleic acid-binding protein
MTQICVDASFVLKILLDELYTPRAVELWAEWIERDLEIVAPFHLVFEVVSVLRNHVYRQVISSEAGAKALAAFLAQDITLLHPDTLLEQGWLLADRFNRPTAYDAIYLALGETLGCDVWTADRRLYNAVGAALPALKLLG